MNYIPNLLEIKSETIDGSERCFCLVRKSYVPATPEEKVRQNFLKYLIETMKFPIDRIKVEESLAHYGKGNRRIDILVLDSNNIPFFIYECKREFEPMTDEVITQALDYFEKLTNVEYLGIVIGNRLELIKYQNNSEDFLKVEQPSFQMLQNGKDNFIKIDNNEYKRNNWKEPIPKDTIKELIDYGIIGEGTDKKYHSFLVNLDGWLLNVNDKLTINGNIEDIGIKTTKFGSAGGGFFAQEYRSFLINNRKDKPIICIALSSMASGKNSPVRTSIMVGIETTTSKNSALQIQIGKSLSIIDDTASIEHNGTITVGKLGASKKQDLLDFVSVRNPELIKDEKVFLGSFDINAEINSTNAKEFIKNVIDYALIRNEFREYKKNEIVN